MKWVSWMGETQTFLDLEKFLDGLVKPVIDLEKCLEGLVKLIIYSYRLGEMSGGFGETSYGQL